MTRAKYKNIGSYKQTSTTVKKLKTKKYYYVQVRTYKKQNTGVFYSKWSNKRMVKVK